MFSYADLVRTEIALEVGERFGVTISEEEAGGWRPLGDVVRSVVGHTGGMTAHTEIFDWVRTLIVEGYGISAELSPDSDVFSDYDRMTAWFMATPHSLGDRSFAKIPGEHSESSAEPTD